MRISALLLSILLSYEGLNAQEVLGLAKDDQGKPLAEASVALKNNKDSSVVKICISDTNGTYEFSSVQSGRYFVAISHAGYLTGNSPSFEVPAIGNAHAPDITLSHLTKQLNQAVVTAVKPLVEVKPDMIVLNVEGSINEVGTDALDLLRKSPGVTVDKDNNISLSGRSAVQVFIDGRPSYLQGSILSEYLKTLQSSSIESIEIISNPSAKYEAAGSAGIINIRLKKNKAYGTNMALSAGYNIGLYSKYNGTLSFNNRDRHLNIFGDVSYNNSLNYSYATMYRTQLDTLFLQQNTLVQSNSTINYKTGMDWFIDHKSTLGVFLSGLSSGYSIRTTSATPIVYLPANQTDRILQADNRTSGSRDNFNADLNYRYADSSGRELNAYADYGVYHLRTNQFQPNSYYDSTGKTLLYSDNYNIVTPTDIDIYSVKADYEYNFLKGRLGYGGKVSYVTTGNDFQDYNIFGAEKELDTLSSNLFNYKENINALYANYRRTLPGWVLQAGLRAENTNLKGTSIGFADSTSGLASYDSSFTRHYTDLFPSASATFNKDSRRQWTLSYSRRIDRPAYQDLNPFEFKLDDYTFSKGNTTLRPQYSNSVSLTFMYLQKLTATLSYSHIKDLSTTLVDTTDGSKAVIEYENLATQDIAGFNISYPFSFKWYSVYVNVNGFYALNKANFGPGRVINLNIFNTSIYSQHSFRLGRGWTGELIQTFTSPSIWTATLISHSLFSLDAGLQKIVLNGNGSFKVSVTDIFKTMRFMATSTFAGQYIRDNAGYESRLLKLYFTYRFGNRQLKAVRSHSNGAEEENKRVNASGGGLTP
jgi:iron complex outermembrane receptor protein